MPSNNNGLAITALTACASLLAINLVVQRSKRPSSAKHTYDAGYEQEHIQMSDDSDSDLSYEGDQITLPILMKHVDSDLSEQLSSRRILIEDIGHDEDCEDEDDVEEEEDSPTKSLPPSSSSSKCIYLDYNGTTPVYTRVLAAMIPYLTRHYGNPSSSHFYGQAPKTALSRARRSILTLFYPSLQQQTASSTHSVLGGGRQYPTQKLRLKEEERSIVFTGCGTEADNLAIWLALESTPLPRNGRKKHVVTSNVEHPAVVECLKVLEAQGRIEVTYISVNTEGIIPADEMIQAIRPDNETILVTLMLANNESGSLQPVRDVALACREKGVLFHTDAAQAIGKVNLSMEMDKGEINDNGTLIYEGIGPGVDMVTIVGHKFGTPKGIAALYVRPGCLLDHDRIEPPTYGTTGVLLVGGGQESGVRSGTENVAYAVGMGYACEKLMSMTKTMKKSKSAPLRRWQKNALHMEEMRTRLLNNLQEELGEENVKPNGPKDPSKRLPNTLSVGLKHVQSGELLKRIQMHVACSAGSACHASGGALSPVLMAMKVPIEFAQGTLRISVGPGTTKEEIDQASIIIANEARKQIRNYKKRIG